MTKYARIVFEIEVADDSTTEEIEQQLNEHITDYLSDMHNVPFDDMEVSDKPYSNW